MPRTSGPALPSDPPETEAQLVRVAADLVQRLLPEKWSQAVEVNPTEPGLYRPDALFELKAPTGERITLIVEAKKTFVPRELAHVINQLRDHTAAISNPASLPMVVARYLPPATRERLIQENIAYADATGNIRVVADRPAVFLRDLGADRDPWRGPGRPRDTLVGEPPARVVRALADHVPPFSVPRLVELSGASTGAAYRVVEFLEREALITRGARGRIEQVDWRALLQRWAKDYGFQRSNRVTSYLQPRGLSTLMGDLATLDDIRYAVTGSLAGAAWAPYAPAAAGMIYTDDAHRLADSLGLREVTTGANVLVAAAAYNVVFDRTETVDGVTVVAPSQAAVDLLGGPGRNPVEAQALLTWMEKHVQQWRR